VATRHGEPNRTWVVGGEVSIPGGRTLDGALGSADAGAAGVGVVDGNKDGWFVAIGVAVACGGGRAEMLGVGVGEELVLGGDGEGRPGATGSRKTELAMFQWSAR
jgi:hypothetical protein